MIRKPSLVSQSSPAPPRLPPPQRPPAAPRPRARGLDAAQDRHLAFALRATSPTRASSPSAATSSGRSTVNATRRRARPPGAAEDRGRREQPDAGRRRTTRTSSRATRSTSSSARSRRCSPARRPRVAQPLRLRVRRACRRRPEGLRRSSCTTSSSCSRPRSFKCGDPFVALDPVASAVGAAEDRRLCLARRPVLVADRRPHSKHASRPSASRPCTRRSTPPRPPT